MCLSDFLSSFARAGIIAVVITAAGLAQSRAPSPDLKKNAPPIKSIYSAVKMRVEQNGLAYETPTMLTYFAVYDQQGRVLESGELLGEKDPDTKTTSKYDDAGNEIEHAYYVHGGLIQRWVATYDPRGRLLHRTYSEGAAVRKGDYTKCVNRLLQSSCQTFGDNRLKQTWITNYDAQGREIERVEKSSSVGSLDRSDTYQYCYDVNGRKIEETHVYMPDDPQKATTYKTTYTYDEKGVLQETASYVNGKLSHRTVKSVDAKGKMEETIEYDGDSNISRQNRLQQIEFDRFGNWTKAYRQEFGSEAKVQTSMDSVVIYRTITYYEQPNTKQ